MEGSAHSPPPPPPPWTGRVDVCSQAVPAAPVGTGGAVFRPFPWCLWPPRLRPRLPDLSCQHKNHRQGQQPGQRSNRQGKEQSDVVKLTDKNSFYSERDEPNGGAWT